jgi:hypothetical protein
MLLAVPVADAYELTDQLSLGGLLAGAGQCQLFGEGAGKPDACRAAVPVRPRLSYRPTERDEFRVELGFAAGNGHNVSPFQLAPWAADLEDDLRDINGRGRGFLLNAWYRHELQLGSESRLSAVLGVIDSSDWLDNNAYANDEYTQFMNAAFVNSPQIFLSSYDPGVALQCDIGNWSMRAVYMNVGKEGDEGEGDRSNRTNLTDRDLGDDYNFFGVEIGFAVRSALGEGHYRLVLAQTSKDFVDPRGESAERRDAYAISFDQELGPNLGAFLRLDQQSDRAAIDYDSAYAAGLHIRGGLWGRERDNVGLGIGLLNGGNQEIKSTRVAEVYYRFVLREGLGLTADLQYMKDDKTAGKDPQGIIVGLRADVHF